jgi:hypothetical protein
VVRDCSRSAGWPQQSQRGLGALAAQKHLTPEDMLHGCGGALGFGSRPFRFARFRTTRARDLDCRQEPSQSRARLRASGTLSATSRFAGSLARAKPSRTQAWRSEPRIVPMPLARRTSDVLWGKTTARRRRPSRRAVRPETPPRSRAMDAADWCRTFRRFKLASLTPPARPYLPDIRGSPA